MLIMATSLSKTMKRTLLNKSFLRNCPCVSSLLESKIAERYLNTNAAYVETAQYPKVKPRYPPGRWEEMEPWYAWLWQKTIDELSLIPNVEGRKDYITDSEMSHINALPFRYHPNYLDFASFATKTAILPWAEMSSAGDMPNNEKSPHEEHLREKIKLLILDQILLDAVVEREVLPQSSDMYSRQKQSKLLMRSIFEILMTSLDKEAPHLKSCQYDENVSVRAVWDRYGIERDRKQRLSPTHYKMNKVLDHRLASSTLFDGMIRSEQPLPQIHERDAGVSIESKKPTLKHKFPVYGVHKVGAQKPDSIVAGHELGDPCEFGLIGYLMTGRRLTADDKYGPTVAQECRLGRGLTSTFTWLAAQAYNQGFSGFIDLTYPLVSQTVMSDGRNFSLLTYQLNTLELWKPDSANDMVNLCWASQEMPLYDSVENGQVKGFNDELLEMLIAMFMRQTQARGYDMKPTILEKEADVAWRDDYIPRKAQVVIEKEEEQYIV